MAHVGEEEDKFKLLTLEFMSEESDPDDSGAMSVHQPQWRSKSNCRGSLFLAWFYTNFTSELTDFLKHLDGRANAANKDSKKFTAERKGRVIAAPLKSLPPTGAPSWTVSKDWMKGINNYCFFI